MESSYLCNAINNCAFLLLNYPTELRPRKGFIEQNPNSYWSCAPQRRLHHNEFGAVAGLVGYMERGLRFLYAFELVLSPEDVETKVLTNKSNKDGKNKINYSIQTGSHDTARDDAHDGANDVGG